MRATTQVTDDICNPLVYVMEQYTTVHGNPQLTLYKQRDKTFIPEQGQVEYYFTTSNIGDALATNAFVVDKFPEDFEEITAKTSGTASDGTVYNCD